MRKIKIDLDYLKPNNTFIYPLCTVEGDVVLDPRTLLTEERIREIKAKYGGNVYYTDTGEQAVIPPYRMKIAYNKAKDIIDEVSNTGKLSRTTLREAEKVVEELVNDLTSSDSDVINLLKDLKSHEEYLYNHSVNVGILTAFFAKKRNRYSKEEIKYITLGAYLHDIGSTKIDKQLLNKQGRLNITEIQKMKRHPQLGYEMLKSMERVSPIVLQTVLFHHEKFNNMGYYGLPYENLPEYPKLVSISDIYDALTSNRPFRKAIPASRAMKAIVNTIDSHFEYELISDFINKVSPAVSPGQSFYTVNDVCELGTSELALIRDFGKHDLLKPKVLVFCKFVRQGNKLNVLFYKNPLEIDLMSDKHRHVTKILSNEQQLSTIKNNLKERGLL